MKKFYLVLMLFISLPSLSEAASVSFVQERDVVQVGDVVQVSVLIDTETEVGNAVDGEITFNTDTLILKNIIDADSVVNFWVTKPTHSDGVISFSGIVPGGFSGHEINLLTLEFETRKEGVGTIDMKRSVLLLNDGLGTEVVSRVAPYSFNILGQSVSGLVTEYVDEETPEVFAPIISRDVDMFDGKAFLVFATEDKGSGIDYYEVKEGERGSYIRAESPYELKDQSLSEKISVRAVDRSGNEYVATLVPKDNTPWHSDSPTRTVLYVLGALVLCLFVYGVRYFRR
jgi:hypothetical protein